MSTDTDVRERAQGAASAAADESKHVAEVAKNEAAEVAGEAAAQARNLIDQTVSQVGDQLGEQTRSQRDNLVSTLRTLTSDLERMASTNEQSGLAADLVREVAQRARGIESAIAEREPQQLLDDVRSFARKRPGAFLLGALAAGVVVGRVVRGAKQGAPADAATGDASPASSDSMTSSAPTAQHDVVGAPHGQPTIAAPGGSAPTQAEGMGTDAAGYGQRSAADGGRPL